jgi:hypothetical protein
VKRLLDPLAIYDRGLADLASLDGVERLLFMLQDFDNLMEMEGWDHFFLYENHFAWYAEMKDWLRQIGDEASLTVLSDYESRIRAKGFEVSPTGIEAWLQAEHEADDPGDPDWCGQYCALREARWERALAHMAGQGFAVNMAEPGAAADGGA